MPRHGIPARLLNCCTSGGFAGDDTCLRFVPGFLFKFGLYFTTRLSILFSASQGWQPSFGIEYCDRNHVNKEKKYHAICYSSY